MLTDRAQRALAFALAAFTAPVIVVAFAFAVSTPAVNTTLPSYMQGSILGMLTSANMNTTADQAITISAAKYIVRRIAATNCSANMTTAAGGVYTAAGKGGTAIVAAVQAYTALTGATKFLDTTLAGSLATDVLTATTLYLSLTIAQGATSTCDMYVIGDALP